MVIIKIIIGFNTPKLILGKGLFLVVSVYIVCAENKICDCISDLRHNGLLRAILLCSLTLAPIPQWLVHQ